MENVPDLHEVVGAEFYELMGPPTQETLQNIRDHISAMAVDFDNDSGDMVGEFRPDDAPGQPELSGVSYKKLEVRDHQASLMDEDGARRLGSITFIVGGLKVDGGLIFRCHELWQVSAGYQLRGDVGHYTEADAQRIEALFPRGRKINVTSQEEGAAVKVERPEA